MPKNGSTSYKETRLGILPQEKIVKLEAIGVKKGIEYVYLLASKKQSLEITPSLVLKLHKISKDAPSYYKIQELIMNLCNDLSEQLKHLPEKSSDKYILEVVRIVAWFQHRFVFIHPFNDYNGRVGRILTSAILLNLNLPPIEIGQGTNKDRKAYIKALQEADDGNYFPLQELIGQALNESLTKKT